MIMILKEQNDLLDYIYIYIYIPSKYEIPPYLDLHKVDMGSHFVFSPY